MRCNFETPTEQQWIELGYKAKWIRDCIMDFCVLSSKRFGASSKMYKNFRILDSSFLRVRSKLDDYVCGAYPITKRTIGEGFSLTSVFFGDRVLLSDFDHLPKYKRKDMPKTFEEAHQQLFVELIVQIESLFESLEQYSYIVSRYNQKESKAIFKRFEKNVQKTNELINNL